MGATLQGDDIAASPVYAHPSTPARRARHLKWALVMIDTLKVLRGEWLTTAQVAETVGLSVEAAQQLCATLAEHGLLDTRPGPAREVRGVRPRQYRVAAAWGGAA